MTAPKSPKKKTKYMRKTFKACIPFGLNSPTKSKLFGCKWVNDKFSARYNKELLIMSHNQVITPMIVYKMIVYNSFWASKKNQDEF